MISKVFRLFLRGVWAELLAIIMISARFVPYRPVGLEDHIAAKYLTRGNYAPLNRKRFLAKDKWEIPV